MSIRIQGLVRAFRRVREELRRGIPDDEREAFRTRVREVVRAVEESCARARTTPARLPAPSRNAYRFLRDLDLDTLPRPGARAEGSKPVRLTGIVRTGEHLCARLWAQRAELGPGTPQRALVLEDLRTCVQTIETLCTEEGATPAGLPLPSRRVFAWMKWLADEEHLARHVECLLRVAAAAPPAVRGLRIHIENTAKLWQVRRRGNDVLVQLSQGFVAAPAALWPDLGLLAAGPVPQEVRRRLRAFANTPEYGALLGELERHAAPPAPEAGLHHDLDACFARVNAAYFAGASAKPRLMWNEVPTVSKFGHYLAPRDTVMVALVLDDAAVPDFVVDFIVYHELLHKELGAAARNGRRSLHTAEFRRRERRFARHAEAERFLAALAARLRQGSSGPSATGPDACAAEAPKT